MTAQINNDGLSKRSIVLNADKTGGSFVAQAPALFVLLGVIFFQETAPEWFRLLGELQLAMILWIVVLMMIGQIRLDPSSYFKPATDVRYFLILASGLLLTLVAAQKGFVEAGFSTLSSIGIDWIVWLISFVVYLAQTLLLAEAIRLGLSWRPGPIMSWVPYVGEPSDNSSIATSDNIVGNVPTVEQLRDKLSSLGGESNKS